MEMKVELRRLCARMGPSRVARELGVDRSTVWRWESGRAAPSPLAQRFIKRVIRDNDQSSAPSE